MDCRFGSGFGSGADSETVGIAPAPAPFIGAKSERGALGNIVPEEVNPNPITTGHGAGRPRRGRSAGAPNHTSKPGAFPASRRTWPGQRRAARRRARPNGGASKRAGFEPDQIGRRHSCYVFDSGGVATRAAAVCARKDSPRGGGVARRAARGTFARRAPPRQFAHRPKSKRLPAAAHRGDEACRYEEPEREGGGHPGFAPTPAEQKAD